MNIKLKKLSNSAKLPVQAHEGDFSFDVWATSEEEIAPNVWMYGLGFRYEIDRQNKTLEFIDLLGMVEKEKDSFLNDCNICIEFRPRSGIYKTGMSLSNSPGTCDEFFRGEPKAIFYHVMPNMPRYKVGDRILQANIAITPKITWEWVDEIDMDTERGEGGFGSTGRQ